MEQKKYFSVEIKPTLFHKKTFLKIGDDCIQLGKNSFSKSEFAAIRYGIRSINGYRFRIGRIYCIDIQNKNGVVFKIRLKSVYRVRIKQLEEKYRMILQVLLTNFINDISRKFLEDFKNEIESTILGVKFFKDGIVLNKSQSIAWLDLGTKSYWSYYSLFSNENPGNYATFQYISDWNTAVLYAVSRAILQSKQLL